MRPPAPTHLYSFPAYVISGVIATTAHYLTTIALVELAGTPPLGATMLGFAIGAFTKYTLNYTVAFRSTERHSLALLRFGGTLALLFVGNAAIFAALTEAIGLQYMIAQVLTTIALTLPGYIASRRWVFQP